MTTPGPIHTGGTFIADCPRMEFPDRRLNGGTTIEQGLVTGGGVGPSGGTEYPEDAEVSSRVRFTGGGLGGPVTWTQQVGAMVSAPGPWLYEPSAEMAADPDAVGWTYPGSGVRWLDLARCNAAGLHGEYISWASGPSSEHSEYVTYRTTHFVTTISAVVGVDSSMSGDVHWPSWASWQVGVPASVHHVVATDGFNDFLHMTSLSTAVDGPTYAAAASDSHSFAFTGAMTTVTGWGEVFAFGVRLTGLPLSTTDLATAPFTEVGVTVTVTATAAKTPFQLLYPTPVVTPTYGVLRTKVSMDGATEADRWQSWGFDNSPAGAGKLLAADGWHVADDDAATVTGLLKVLDHDGTWRDVSWMTEA